MKPIPSINCIQHRNNTLLIAFGAKIVWDNQLVNGSWVTYLASSADFAGADDNQQLGKGERAWDQDHQTHSLTFDYNLLV